MRVRGFLVGALLAALATTSASAAVRIQHDSGGQIGPYLENFAMIRNSGQQVIIDGPCLSACTMLLGIVPKEKVCVTGRARLGFHAAWLPGPGGQPVISAAGTQVLWDVYPQPVRNWIKRRGGLSKRMIYLQGRELTAMYPPCR